MCECVIMNYDCDDYELIMIVMVMKPEFFIPVCLMIVPVRIMNPAFSNPGFYERRRARRHNRDGFMVITMI